MGRIRAITEIERAARRNQILDATLHLLGRWSPHDVSVERVADQAGIAKGTVYLYFRTREELLLGVFARLQSAWLSRLAETLAHSPGRLDPFGVGRITASTLAASPALLRLFGLSNLLFSGNVSTETHYDFRLRQRREIEEVASVLEERVSGVSRAQACRWLVRIETFLAGLVPRAQPRELSTRVLERPELSLFAVDLHDELQYIATTLLLPS
jgi:AcrR family transcriptional regulator